MVGRYWRTRDRRRCNECGDWLALDARAIYCGSACRSAAYRRRKRQAERPDRARYVRCALCSSQDCDSGPLPHRHDAPTEQTRVLRSRATTESEAPSFGRRESSGTEDRWGECPESCAYSAAHEVTRSDWLAASEMGSNHRTGGCATDPRDSSQEVPGGFRLGPVDTATSRKVATALSGFDVDRFYADVLDALGDLARAGGSAVGAAAVVKRVALAHGVSLAESLPLPRLTRVEREELGVAGASFRRVRRSR